MPRKGSLRTLGLESDKDNFAGRELFSEESPEEGYIEMVYSFLLPEKNDLRITVEMKKDLLCSVGGLLWALGLLPGKKSTMVSGDCNSL